MTISNRTFADMNDFLKRVDALGREFGQGALSRPEFIIQTAIAAQEGVITEDNAPAVWARFDKACDKKITMNVVLSDKDTALNQRISEVRTIIHVAAYDFLSEDTLADMLTKAKGIIVQAKQKGNYSGNSQDGLMRVVRAQKKKKKAGEDEALNEDEITAAVLGDTSVKELTEKRSLERIKKLIDVHLNGTKGTKTTPPKPAFPSESMSAALELVEEALGVATLRENPAHNSMADAGY